MMVTVIVEKASDERYSCYAEEEFDCFGLAGYGDTQYTFKIEFS